MRYLGMWVLLVSFLIFSCSSESSSPVENNNEMEGPADPESMNEEEVTIALVNAFPNLSFSQPLDLQAPNNGSNKVYVAEKGGVIKVFDNESSTTETETFLDLGNISTTSEQGLLGFTFHPSFEMNGHFFVYYTPNTNVSFISRFTVSQANPNLADANSELVILEISQPQTNHNGGQIAFGPDGYLYIAVGDGGGAGDPNRNSQNRANLLGNILRIDIDNTQEGLNYAIPADNPYVNEPNFRSEIYAYGLRNPWRMSFDTQTGKLWTADVGQNKIEEIDLVESGKNYGWNLFEGLDCFSGDCNSTNLAAPIFEYTQDNGDRSITGGYVYRGAENASIQGKYVYGDFVSGRIWALNEDGSGNRLVVASGLSISSFGTDDDQELYVCAFDGSIYKFQETTN
ncbi:MAG: PQQ-dependent sugar dehydrogenase [Aurantibacter sp.]